MKTIKELDEVENQSWSWGYKQCRKDVIKLIDEWEKKFRISLQWLKSKIEG